MSLLFLPVPETEALKQLLMTESPPELGPGPRSGVRDEGSIKRALEEAFRGSALAGEQKQLIRALVLLWHDHLEPAHSIAQEIDNSDGAFVHGIMHRREPDYGNAKYWFRRVGRHATFPRILQRVKTAVLPGEAALGKLVSGAEWDPFLFVDLCQKAAGSASRANEVMWLRQVQRIESEVLLEHFYNA